MSVASRVERGLHLVAGGGSRAAGESCAPAVAGARAASSHVQPAGQAILSELFPALPRDAGWTGFVLHHLSPAKPLLWVQERMAILESGRVHAAGLGPLGPNLIHVEARDAKAALWAMEEGLRCEGLGGVIGELWGDPQALDFTATRRLAVAAERTGVACWLVRLAGAANLSGARERWRLASAPSLAHTFDPKAPGAPRWSAELFRSRRRHPATWLLGPESTGNDPADLLPVAAEPRDRALGGWQRRA
nr:recA-like protein [uncultured Sphingomonas sp.]